MISKTSKVGIIGAGNVGADVANALVLLGRCVRVVLFDHVDETPWSVKGIKEWLWVVANSDFCLFTAADTRSRAELSAILGTEYTVD